MAEYTYKDIIIDPTSEEAKNAVGEGCYFGSNPKTVLDFANCNEKKFLRVLECIKPEEDNPFYDYNYGFSCIIVKKEEPYAERAKKWIKENGLKKGDYVKVVRKAKDYEDGWDGRWTKERDDFIGKVIPVSDIGESTGVILSYCCCDWAGYDFPYFVLEKVEPEPKYVPFESKEEFIEAFHYHDNSKYSETDDILLKYGMWLKLNELYVLVTCISDEYIKTFESYYFWNDLPENFEFLDGTPCGKESKDV